MTAVLAVNDVERSARFYGDAFGFDVAPFPQHPPYQCALLTRGGAELMLRAAVSPEAVRPAPGWAIYVRLSGGRIRELFDHLAESCEIVRTLQRMPYDVWSSRSRIPTATSSSSASGSPTRERSR